VREHHVTDDAVAHQPAQAHGQRLVVIVLAHQHHARGAVARGTDGLVVPGARERGLLHQHVLARGQRLEREIEVAGGRHRHHHRIDARVVDGRLVAAEGGDAAEPAPERVGLLHVAAGVARRHHAPEPAQVPAVDLGDEPAPEKRHVNRRGSHGRPVVYALPRWWL
jgi:hypothetical protein